MRDGEISTLGVGGKRLTADNQLGRQSDSKEMMESIKIFYRGTPSCHRGEFPSRSTELSDMELGEH